MKIHEFVLLISCALVPVAAQAHERTATVAERTACEAKIRPKLERIESRLRAGHAVIEGESLRAQRRKLEQQLLSCRKVST